MHDGEWYGRWYTMGEDRFPGVQALDPPLRNLGCMIAALQQRVPKCRETLMGTLKRRPGRGFEPRHYVSHGMFEFGLDEINGKRGLYRVAYCRLNREMAGQIVPSTATLWEEILHGVFRGG